MLSLFSVVYLAFFYRNRENREAGSSSGMSSLSSRSRDSSSLSSKVSSPRNMTYFNISIVGEEGNSVFAKVV